MPRAHPTGPAPGGLPTPARGARVRLALLAPLVLAFGLGPACDFPEAFFFRAPLLGLLTLADGATPIEIQLPLGAEVEGLEVRLDGVPVLGLDDLTIEGRVARGALGELEPGRYQLEAQATLAVLGALPVELETATWFERAAIERPDACESLNGVECALPFPSSRFLEPADTETGVRVVYPEGVLPSFGPAPLSSAAFGIQDGFSPAAQVLMHFPGGVDPALSGASRLLPDTRTFDDTSLQPDSPTLLFDVDDGMRQVPHFIEPESRALGIAGQEARSGLFLRPAEGLVPGHRYIVALRELRSPAGTPVEAEPVFAALRDRRPTDIPGVEARRGPMNQLFARLAQAGVAREDLVLAFDFVVESEQSLTRELLAMRDRAYAWLAAESGPTFSVFPFAGPDDDTDGDVSIENDCGVEGERLWRRVRGTFQAPLFLSADPLLEPVVGSRLVDEVGDGLPEVQGLMDANFSIEIPCAALDEGGARLAPILLGHGLFGNGRQAVGLARSLDQVRVENGLGRFLRIGGATDWLGLSSFDLDFANLLAPSFIVQAVLFDPDNFATLPDRLRQGATNAAVLARMMKEGRFNAHAAFQTAPGVGVFPTGETPVDYFGVSLGGIMGTLLAAISPDFARMAVDVPASNFSILIQRSSAIGLIAIPLNFLNTDRLSQALFFGLAEELWDSAEPTGYLRQITRDPLPGAGGSKDLLVTLALFDGVVANVASDIYGRTLGLPNLRGIAPPSGSALSDQLGVPDRAGPLSESDPDFVGAQVWYDIGNYDLSNPDEQVFLPPLANRDVTSPCETHAQAFQSVAAAQQITTWLDAGRIENFCDGVCDAFAAGGGFAPEELARGRTVPCDPLRN